MEGESFMICKDCEYYELCLEESKTNKDRELKMGVVTYYNNGEYCYVHKQLSERKEYKHATQ